MNESDRDTVEPSSATSRGAPARVSITQKIVDKALADARAGKACVLLDAQCPGLELRGWKGGTVNWTLRYRLHGYQRRAVVGDHTVAAAEARKRGWQVKDRAKRSLNPDTLIAELVTGLRADQVTVGQSWPWETARDNFLDEKRRTRRRATYDDYRNILTNTPELKPLAGRAVGEITDTEIAGIYGAVHRRGAETHAGHVARVISSMWGWLSEAAQRDGSRVSIARAAEIRATKPPERTRREFGEQKSVDDREQPPSLRQIGRMIAIAKSGALDRKASAAILLTAATAQRRRTVASLYERCLVDRGDEIEWAIPPAHRKTARKIRSESPHRIPLLGWAAAAARDLKRGTNGLWLFPAGPTDGGKDAPTRFEHVDPGWLTKLHSWLPGGFNPHRWRKALATYGREHLGWAKGDAKLILDHAEGNEADDVTTQHYDLDPQMLKKRAMLAAWLAFLDAQAVAAIDYEPWLTDLEVVREKVYRGRYGDEAWQRAVDRARKRQEPLPWAVGC